MLEKSTALVCVRLANQGFAFLPDGARQRREI